MHEAIGEDIAESSCFLMVTLHFRRVNSTIVWRYSRPCNKLPRGGARKRGEPKQGTMYRPPTRKDGRLESRTRGPGGSGPPDLYFCEVKLPGAGGAEPGQVVA